MSAQHFNNIETVESWATLAGGDLSDTAGILVSFLQPHWVACKHWKIFLADEYQAIQNQKSIFLSPKGIKTAKHKIYALLQWDL